MSLNLNTPDADILWNIEKSIRRNLKQVVTHIPNPTEVALITGGPSLEATFGELEQLVEAGVKTVTVNGTHDYLLDRGIRPSAMVICDAREFNKRFAQRPQKGCKYFVASQCHPAIYDALDMVDVYQFHLHQGIGEHEVVERELGRVPWIVGGCTVGLRAIHLMRVLGFQKMHIFGMDSCRTQDKQHHAYPQKENDFPYLEEVTFAGRTFVCDYWMLEQFNGFVRLAKTLGDLFELQIHGDGMIAHFVKTIAETGKNPLEDYDGRICMGNL